MRFEVPTSENLSQKLLMIHWTPTEEKATYLQQKEKTKLLKNYAETGRFTDIFTPQEIEDAKKGRFPKTEFAGHMYPMPWDFHYFIPTNMGGREDPKNIRFINNKTYYDFRQKLLFPLEAKMKAVAFKFDYCVFQMPAPPRVVTDDWFQKFYTLNQQAEKDFSKKREIYYSDTSITEIKSGDVVILTINHHPFIHCPTKLVRVESPVPNARADFLQDIKLHHKIYRRDAMALKGLNKEERADMLHCHHYPNRLKLQLHHILGLSLGGKNEPENLLFIKPEVHKIFNATVENPLKYFIEGHAGYPGQELYIEMPVPMEAYKVRDLPTKIPELKPKKPKEKRIARRKVRRQSQYDLKIIIEIYDYEREN